MNELKRLENKAETARWLMGEANKNESLSLDEQVRFASDFIEAVNELHDYKYGK